MKYKITSELKNFGIFAAVILALFMIAFYKEPVFGNVAFALSLFYLYIIPGYFLIYSFTKNMVWLERVILAMFLGIAIYTIFSYIFGLFGIPIYIHHYILPGLFILVGVGIIILRDHRK